MITFVTFTQTRAQGSHELWFFILEAIYVSDFCKVLNLILALFLGLKRQLKTRYATFLRNRLYPLA